MNKAPSVTTEYSGAYLASWGDNKLCLELNLELNAYAICDFRFQKNEGFTLLELLVVIVIIGLLAAYVGPRYFSQLGKSERSTAKAQIEGFGRALDSYRLDTGHYPDTTVGLKALVERPASESKWNGPYLQKAVPLDPWGNAYVYRKSSATGQDFDIFSYGKDGRPGGEGENADISFR